jgi:DNA-directed RNA polymerase specialized sigma24 family protein
VTDEPPSGDDEARALVEIEDALVSHFFLGLVAQLQRQFDNLGSADSEDAVAHAVEKLVLRVKAGPPVRDVKAYVARSAFNALNREANRRKRVQLVPLDERDDRIDAESAEDIVLRRAALELVRAEVRTWENAHVRAVTSVWLDVLESGEVVETEEIAEIVAVNLGEEISAGSVRTWKARGLKKLHAFVEREQLAQTRRPDDQQEKEE